MTPACPKPTKNQSYAEPVQLSRPEYPSQSPTHHADTQISTITLKSSASKTPREKSGLEPLAEAILAHQNKAALRHADETSWHVQELRGEDRSSRAWLWVSVSNDAVSFHIDPSRSAEAAQKLFGDALLDTVIVCDRYSAYKRLARSYNRILTGR